MPTSRPNAGRRPYPKTGRRAWLEDSVERLFTEASDIRTWSMTLPELNGANDHSYGGGVRDGIAPSLVAPRDRVWYWMQVSALGLAAAHPQTLQVDLYVGGAAASNVCFTLTLNSTGVAPDWIYGRTQAIVNEGKETMLAESTTWGIRVRTSAGADWSFIVIELAYEDFSPYLSRAVSV